MLTFSCFRGAEAGTGGGAEGLLEEGTCGGGGMSKRGEIVMVVLQRLGSKVPMGLLVACDWEMYRGAVVRM